MRCETGSPNFLVSGRWEIDYSRAPCLGADQKTRGLWERDCKAGVKRRTSHEPNRMLMRENKESFSFAFGSCEVRRLTRA